MILVLYREHFKSKFTFKTTEFLKSFDLKQVFSKSERKWKKIVGTIKEQDSLRQKMAISVAIKFLKIVFQYDNESTSREMREIKIIKIGLLHVAISTVKQ